MAERHPRQSDDRSQEGHRDPFAELALIIGFDPRQKIRGPAAAASKPDANADERTSPVGAAAGPERTRAMSDEAEAPGEARTQGGAEQDAPDEWIDLPPLDLNLQESEEAGAGAPEAAEAQPAADVWTEDDSDRPFLDDEGWQQAVAASLDRITGEIEEHAAGSWPSRAGPSASIGGDEPLSASPAAGRLALEPSAPEARDVLDEELSIEAADWDALELDIAGDDAASPGSAAEDAWKGPSAPAEEPLKNLDLEGELDLDAVLAQSIERELEAAWGGDIAAAVPAPAEMVQTERPEPQRLRDGTEPDADNLDSEDLRPGEPEPAAAPEPTSRQDQPVSAGPEQEEPWADVPEPEFEAFDPPLQAEEPRPAVVGSEADFEAELGALLAAADDDEPGIGLPQASGAVAETRRSAAPQALGPSPAAAATRGREPPAASAERTREGLEPRVEPTQAAPEPVRPAPRQPSPPPPAEDDPFAALAAMAARYRSGLAARPLSPTPSAERTAPEPTPEAAPPRAEQNVESEDPVDAMRNQPPSRHETPEIETVDVPEQATALADDLDIPDVPVERAHAPRAPFDDLDTEFAELLQEMTEGRRAPPPAPSFRPAWDATSQSAPRAQDFSQASPRHEPQGYAAPNAEEMFDPDEHAAAARWRHANEERDADDMGAAETIEGFEQEDEEPAMRGRGRRGFWLASLLAGVVLAGGVGAYAVGSGGIAISGAPALIKADAGPVKVRPENPGGVKVPNQDNKVYQRVAGAPLDTPTQAKLVASAEEPVSLVEPVQPTPPADDLSLEVGGDSIEAIVKVDERFAPAPAGEPEPAPAREEAVTVVPRKVRTMTVRADGTLVPNDGAAPTEAPQALVEPQVAAAQEAIRKVSGAAEAQAMAPDVTATGAVSGRDQPAAALVEVAALQPGAWSMQIASQPSEEGARNAYKDLAERFGGVLGARGVNIVKAEIEGKGTFWRVRIPAESRNDAVSLCESYKAAGGSCFVSK